MTPIDDNPEGSRSQRDRYGYALETDLVFNTDERAV